MHVSFRVARIIIHDLPSFSKQKPAISSKSKIAYPMSALMNLITSLAGASDSVAKYSPKGPYDDPQNDIEQVAVYEAGGSRHWLRQE